MDTLKLYPAEHVGNEHNGQKDERGPHQEVQ